MHVTVISTAFETNQQHAGEKAAETFSEDSPTPWMLTSGLCAAVYRCSVFLFFVMRRLLDIQGQLYSMRALAKEAATQQQQLLLTAGSAGDEQQRLLSKTLTQMARSSVDDGEAQAVVGSKQD